MSRSPLSQTKAEAKRAFLIEQATLCLAQKGYAHVSLRDIAKESGVSLGILHYYFASKEDLLLAIISSYKEGFVAELEREVVEAPLDDWMASFFAVLHRSLTRDKDQHRLWYDLQVQAMYVPAFHAQVSQIRNRLHSLIMRMLERVTDADGSSLAVEKEAAASTLYSLIDGLFLQSMLSESSDHKNAISQFEQTFPFIVQSLFLPSSNVHTSTK
ncbi:TetR/AcrR family transcriptional regulator [uncultured Brevibacillus sp.]|uniref:TetR/AcrR family transcriptional regulator n=1 Tax=uncultured Brevibacillus sp. TaxID=169970 RepID=UPI00259AE6BE|nr:TetR/AcrR family transcriptional regulator [uncultured Brevibacillus sp.]